MGFFFTCGIDFDFFYSRAWQTPRYLSTYNVTVKEASKWKTSHVIFSRMPRPVCPSMTPHHIERVSL